MKPDAKCTSKAQVFAQEKLRELHEVAACFDLIDAQGGIDDLPAHPPTASCRCKVATTRCIDILTTANSDAECLEALRLIADIIRPVVSKRPLQ